MREPFKVWETIPVRWADMDSMGHVNNAKYFTFCESARMRYFEVIGLYDHRQGRELGPALVSANCNFRRQVHHPATLEVGARVVKVGRSSFHLDYVVLLEGTETVVADGSSVVVWIDYAQGKAEPLPAALAEKIREFDDVPISG